MKASSRTKRIKRHKRVKARILKAGARPRLSVFRSNKHVFLQIIDDTRGKTLIGMGDFAKEKGKKKKMTKTDSARELGRQIAAAAVAKNIKKVVFDRGGFKYHGRVKAVAEGVREGGLEF